MVVTAQAADEDWIAKAWSAWRASESAEPSEHDRLIAWLREAAPLQDAVRDSAPYAYVQTLLDLSIRSNLIVPLDALRPFENEWRAEVLILIARLDPGTPGLEDALFKMREHRESLAEWSAVNNLLFRIGSPRYFSRILGEVPITHEFVLSNSTVQVARCGGGFGCGIGERKLPSGLPQIALYDLSTDPGVLSATIPGPANVTYATSVVEPDGVVTWNHCEIPVNEQLLQSHDLTYLAGMAHIKPEEAYTIFAPSTSIISRDSDEIAHEMASGLETQAQAILRFIKEHYLSLGNLSGMRLSIESKVTDLRTEGQGPLPQPPPTQITIN